MLTKTENPNVDSPYPLNKEETEIHGEAPMVKDITRHEDVGHLNDSVEAPDLARQTGEATEKYARGGATNSQRARGAPRRRGRQSRGGASNSPKTRGATRGRGKQARGGRTPSLGNNSDQQVDRITRRTVGVAPPSIDIAGQPSDSGVYQNTRARAKPNPSVNWLRHMAA